MNLHLKTREQIVAERLGAINEDVIKKGDIYQVKARVDVPKSLINAFVSKCKKEFDIDPREDWSDKEFAELFVDYITKTFLNIDSIPVDAIIGETEKKEGEENKVQTQPTAQVQPEATVTTMTEPEAQVSIPVQNTEETKIANIPSTLSIQEKKRK